MRTLGTLRHSRAFTLIELLVVIAIIAILAAILFPVFARAREAARQASCTSNLKQVGTAVMMYAQDFDELMPFNYMYDSAMTNLWWWQDLCRPYIKNEQVYSCPSAAPHMPYTYLRPAGTPSPLIKDYIANSTAGVAGGLTLNGVNYGSSAGSPIVGPFVNGWGNPGVSLAEIEDVAGTISIFDGAYGYFEVWRTEQVDAIYNATGQCSEAAGYTWDPRPQATRCTDGFVSKRHNEGFVCAFVDGHTKWIKKSTLGQWSRRAGD